MRVGKHDADHHLCAGNATRCQTALREALSQVAKQSLSRNEEQAAELQALVELMCERTSADSSFDADAVSATPKALHKTPAENGEVEQSPLLSPASSVTVCDIGYLEGSEHAQPSPPNNDCSTSTDDDRYIRYVMYDCFVVDGQYCDNPLRSCPSHEAKRERAWFNPWHWGAYEFPGACFEDRREGQKLLSIAKTAYSINTCVRKDLSAARLSPLVTDALLVVLICPLAASRSHL